MSLPFTRAEVPNPGTEQIIQLVRAMKENGWSSREFATKSGFKRNRVGASKVTHLRYYGNSRLAGLLRALGEAKLSPEQIIELEKSVHPRGLEIFIPRSNTDAVGDQDEPSVDAIGSWDDVKVLVFAKKQPYHKKGAPSSTMPLKEVVAQLLDTEKTTDEMIATQISKAFEATFYTGLVPEKKIDNPTKEEENR
eukprot:GEMP01106008.1.p1 GENE.GEMP01106008.1~~GEMP01106008.1.p1  ORF type:complete len:194 (+),score=37.55 GEMP01106008.1:43-624(+)